MPIVTGPNAAHGSSSEAHSSSSEAERDSRFGADLIAGASVAGRWIGPGRRSARGDFASNVPAGFGAARPEPNGRSSSPASPIEAVLDG
jgi:hypothetical protein